jgi:hypothetical protein
LVFLPHFVPWLICDHAEYCCIDGGTAHNNCISAINKYNKSGSKMFIFLLTTCTGGLNINLTTANIVVLNDCDWCVICCYLCFMTIFITKKKYT